MNHIRAGCDATQSIFASKELRRPVALHHRELADGTWRADRRMPTGNLPLHDKSCKRPPGRVIPDVQPREGLVR